MWLVGACFWMENFFLVWRECDIMHLLPCDNMRSAIILIDLSIAETYQSQLAIKICSLIFFLQNLNS